MLRVRTIVLIVIAGILLGVGPVLARTVGASAATFIVYSALFGLIFLILAMLSAMRR